MTLQLSGSTITIPPYRWVKSGDEHQLWAGDECFVLIQQVGQGWSIRGGLMEKHFDEVTGGTLEEAKFRARQLLDGTTSI